MRRTLRGQLAPLLLNVYSRLAMYDTGAFAKLGYLGLEKMRIEEIDVLSSRSPAGARFLGMPVHDVATPKPKQHDRIIVG